MATEPSPAILVYRRASGRFDALRESLGRADFHAVSPPDAAAEWEVVDGAGTRVRGCGKAVVVEARDSPAACAFDARFRLAFPSEHAVPDGGEAPVAIDRIAGSDEAGKGDRARALAVAAVVVPRAAEREAIRRGVRDSKTCSAEELVALADWVRASFPNEVRVLGPDARAAALRAHGGNESRLLAAMHAECLDALYGRGPFAFVRVDRFAPGRPVAVLLEALVAAEPERVPGGRRPEVFVDECVRGERHVACAAASIVAGAVVRATSHGNGAWHVP